MIDLEKDGDVFVLHMCAGENRFNRTFLDALVAALDEVEKSEGPAALVTTGEGKFDSNGLDLAWMGGEACVAHGVVREAVPEADVLPRAPARPLAGKDRATHRALKRRLYEAELAILEG